MKFQDVKLKDPNVKHDIFMRIDMKYSYFSTIFFSVVELNCLLLMPKINSLVLIVIEILI